MFAVPSGHSWALPAYELALLTAAQLEHSGRIVEVTVATPERAPLEVFGDEISQLVRGMMAGRAVRFVSRVTPRAFAHGSLELPQLPYEPPIQSGMREEASGRRHCQAGRRLAGGTGEWASGS